MEKNEITLLLVTSIQTLTLAVHVKKALRFVHTSENESKMLSLSLWSIFIVTARVRSTTGK